MKKSPPPATTTALFLIASALLSTLIHPPTGWASLAWIAAVPFVLACDPRTKPHFLALTAFIVASVYWLINLYWLSPVTIPGWVIFSLYTALIAPLLALALRTCRRQGWPLSLCVAILWVGAEQFQGFLLGGFAWRYLAHSQFQNLPLIQIADLTGAAGVSWVVALVNGLFVDIWLSTRQRRTWRRLAINTTLVTMTLGSTLGYGHWRLQQTKVSCRPGPRVGVIQTNVPQAVKDTFQASDQILTDLLSLSEECSQNHPDVIIWPETMVQTILDPNISCRLGSKDYQNACMRVHQLLGTFASRNSVNLLVGTFGGKIELNHEQELIFRNYNSIAHYLPNGALNPIRYDKIHLVLFGEYLPFKYSWPWLHRQLIKCTPYNYDYTVDPGTEHSLFTIKDSNHPTDVNTLSPTRCGIIICFEATIPRLARAYSYDNRGNKPADWLVNVSNDGWFVHFDDEKQEVQPTAELAQHVATCVFRAVENRQSIMRCVNVGISCLITSTGEIRSGYKAASPNFPENALDRQGLAGWFVDRVPIDTRNTLFSRGGQWLDKICATVFALLGFGSAWTSRRQRTRAQKRGRKK